MSLMDAAIDFRQNSNALLSQINKHKYSFGNLLAKDKLCMLKLICFGTQRVLCPLECF